MPGPIQVFHAPVSPVPKLEDILERKGWRLHDRSTEAFAGRTFQYAQGAVLLSMHNAVGRPGRNRFAARVTLPYAAGPEDSVSGTFLDCLAWISKLEKILTIPYRLADCRRSEQAREVIGHEKMYGLVLLCQVFDLHPGGGHEALRQRIVRHVCRINLTEGGAL